MKNDDLDIVKKNQKFIEKAEKTIENIKELHDIVKNIESEDDK